MGNIETSDFLDSETTEIPSNKKKTTGHHSASSSITKSLELERDVSPSVSEGTKTPLAPDEDRPTSPLQEDSSIWVAEESTTPALDDNTVTSGPDKDTIPLAPKRSLSPVVPTKGVLTLEDVNRTILPPDGNKTARSKTSRRSSALQYIGRLFSRDQRRESSSRKLTSDEIEVVEEYLQTFVLLFCGQSIAGIYDILCLHATVCIFDPGTVILSKDEPSCGLYIVMDGDISLTSHDGKETIATISSGDVLGELSTFYNIPCTARVQSTTSSLLAHLEEDVVRDLIGQPKYDVINWCVQSRYLPTGSDVDSGRLYRRSALSYLRQLTMFHEWPGNALKSLILSLGHPTIVVYEAKSFIAMETDPPHALNIVVRGSIEVSRGQTLTITFTTGSDTIPFVIGERALLMAEDSTKSVSTCTAITVRAVTCCHVLHIAREYLVDAMEMFADARKAWDMRWMLWNNLVEGWGSLYSRYTEELQPEVILYRLGLSPLLYGMPNSDLENMLLHARLVQTTDTGSLGDNQDKYEFMYLVKGEVMVTFDPDKATSNITSVSECQLCDLREPGADYNFTTSCILLLLRRI